MAAAVVGVAATAAYTPRPSSAQPKRRSSQPAALLWRGRGWVKSQVTRRGPGFCQKTREGGPLASQFATHWKKIHLLDPFPAEGGDWKQNPPVLWAEVEKRFLMCVLADFFQRISKMAKNGHSLAGFRVQKFFGTICRSLEKNFPLAGTP